MCILIEIYQNLLGFNFEREISKPSSLLTLGGYWPWDAVKIPKTTFPVLEPTSPAEEPTDAEEKALRAAGGTLVTQTDATQPSQPLEQAEREYWEANNAVAPELVACVQAKRATEQEESELWKEKL